MSRRRNKTPFKDYERVSDSIYQVGYIRMLDVQLVCMNELSANAFRLYIMMKSYAKGEVEFKYPHRIYKNIMSNQTFIEARKELIDKGYLEPFITKQFERKENIYRFSGKWRDRNREVVSKAVRANKT